MLRVLASLIATASLAAVPVHAADAPAEAPAAAQILPAIGVVAVVEATLKDRVVASGTVKPAETVLVQPQVEGQATEELFVDVGDRVEKGQVMARLSDSQLTLQRSQLVASLSAAEASVAQARAQIAEAEASRAELVRARDRARTLKAQGNIAQAALDDVELPGADRGHAGQRGPAGPCRRRGADRADPCPDRRRGPLDQPDRNPRPRRGARGRAERAHRRHRLGKRRDGDVHADPRRRAGALRGRGRGRPPAARARAARVDPRGRRRRSARRRGAARGAHGRCGHAAWPGPDRA